MTNKMKLIHFAAAVAVLPVSLALAEDQQKSGERSPAAISSSAQQEQGQARDQQRFDGQAQRSQQSQQAPEGFVLIEERVVYLLANEPQQHFIAALQKLSQNDNKAAAAEIRIASNYLEMQGSRGQENQKIRQASSKLDKLAAKVEKGEMKSPEKVQQAFSQANVALADLFQAQAHKALEQNKFVMAGHDLENAALSFREALTWSKQAPSQEQVGVINNAMTVARELRAERMSVADRQPDDDSATADDRAQPAAARDPRVGTTPAEAQNVAEHGRKVIKALGEQLEQFSSKLGDQQQQKKTGAESDKQAQQGQEQSQ